MAIKIIAKKDGFRRAGLAHHGIKVYPGEAFSEAQVAALTAEPNLAVTFVDDKELSGESPEAKKGDDEKKKGGK